jgi:NhaP-type Na+/H+ or K+/H+ antiporter
VGSALDFTTDLTPILYALLSLTVIRMLPVAIAMRGVGLRRDTIGLMGWFGPRGLASVVFTILALQEFTTANHAIDVLVAVATWTILLSVLAHGLSARPLAAWYARRLAQTEEPTMELADAPELRLRRSILHTAPSVGSKTE